MKLVMAMFMSLASSGVALFILISVCNIIKNNVNNQKVCAAASAFRSALFDNAKIFVAASFLAPLVGVLLHSFRN